MAKVLIAALAAGNLMMMTGALAQQPQRPAQPPASPGAAAPVSPDSRPVPVQAFAALAGQWDMLTADGKRKCRLTLRPADVPGGKAVGFPASCRRPLPILGRVAAWGVTPDGLIRLNDVRGNPVLIFAEAPAPFRLTSTVENVEYQLDSLGRMRRFVERVAISPQQRAQINPANAPAFDTLPGLYGMIRPGDQEVCRINLSTQPGAQEGRYLANFPTRCRDRGLQVFDAVAWRYSGGKLFLIARRGHEITLIPDGPNQWSKDPPSRSDLTLRKAN